MQIESSLEMCLDEQGGIYNEKTIMEGSSFHTIEFETTLMAFPRYKFKGTQYSNPNLCILLHSVINMNLERTNTSLKPLPFV